MIYDWEKLRGSDLNKTDVRNDVRQEFVTMFRELLGQHPHKQVFIDFSSGCSGCRSAAYQKALNLIQTKKREQ